MVPTRQDFIQKRTLGADVAEELAAFRQRRGRRLRNSILPESITAELPPRRMKRSTRGVEDHCHQRPCRWLAAVVCTAYAVQMGAKRDKQKANAAATKINVS